MAALTDIAEINLITGFNRTGLTNPSNWGAQAYVVGDIVRAATWNNRLYKCVVAGTSSGVEPTFSTVIGIETTDSGGVIWQTCGMGPLKEPIFIALYTASPGESGVGGTEVFGGGYARVAYQPTDANWDAGASPGGNTANTQEIIFPLPVGANWGTITHMAQVDRLAGTGTLFSYAVLTTPRVVNMGDQAPKFAVGALTAAWD